MKKSGIYRFFSLAITVLLSTVLTGTRLSAQNLSIETQVDTPRFLIGDQVTLKLLIEAPKTVKFKWPSIPDSMGKLEIISKGPIDTLTKSSDSQQRFRQVFYVSSYDSGSYTLPPLRVVYRKEDDTTNFASESLPIEIIVYSPKVDTTAAIRDIKSLLDVPYTFMEILPYLLGGVFIIALALAIYYYIKKRREAKNAFVPVVPKKPAHEIAIEQLTQLQQEKLWQQGYVKDYHTRITDTLRTYIESRFQVHTMEQTSDEILQSLSHTHLSSDEQHNLARLLRIADMVKFAKAQPLPAEHEFALSYALEFVKHTIPTSVNTIATEGFETSTQSETKEI